VVFVAGMVSASLLWTDLQTIAHNVELSRQVQLLEQQTATLKAKWKWLQNQAEWYRSDSYKERAARSGLGL
jgi:hypothetical protein